MLSSRRLNEYEHEPLSDEQSQSHERLIIPTRNLLLASLPRVDSSRLVESSRPVRLRAGDVIYEDSAEIDFLYLPIDAVISSLALLEDGSSVEVSMTGREGIVGLPALVGGGRALQWTRVSVGGSALKISKLELRNHFEASEIIHSAVLKAYRSLFTQICQRSVCNSRHTLLQRLSLYLLMMSDRLDSDELPMTQEEIASRISVRRAGVSVAASMLEAMHGIVNHRRRIVITERPILERCACECYQILKDVFENVGGGKHHRFGT